MSERNKIIDRVKKILALANNNTNEHEAASAAATAAKLMEKYNLSQSEVIIKELSDEDCVTKDTAGKEYRAMPKWMGSIAIGVARMFDCECKFEFNFGRKSIAFYGYDVDVIVCKQTYIYLLDEINRLTDVWWQTADQRFYGQSANKCKNSYKQGISNTINTRLSAETKERKQREQVQQAGTSLVIVKKNAIAKKFGGFKYKSGRTRTGDHSAYQAGRSAGHAVNWNRQVSGATQGRLAG